MSTPTSFQVIQQTATELNGVLHNAQAENYRNLIKVLRDQVLLEASDTADFTINNIFSELLKPGATTAHKQITIDRFRNAQALRTKLNSAKNLLREMQLFRDSFANGGNLTTQGNTNPTAVMNRMDTIILGVQSVVAFYAQIGTTLTELKGIIDGNHDPVQKIQEETKWLAAVSKDYKAFRPDL